MSTPRQRKLKRRFQPANASNGSPSKLRRIYLKTQQLIIDHFRFVFDDISGGGGKRGGAVKNRMIIVMPSKSPVLRMFLVHTKR